MHAAYIHNLDPVIVKFSDALQLRWYGLSYVAGFLAAYLILVWLARRKLWVVEEEKVGDVVTYTAIFGVFLGGRIGYVLFYMIPRDGWDVIMNDPMTIIRVWDGGMASHGGILGIMVFTLFYSWRHNLSWAGLGDGISIVAPLGVFFGRVANFINGELYGTTTDEKNWWAVKFPKSLFEKGNEENLQNAIRQIAVTEKGWTVTKDIPQDLDGTYFVGRSHFEQIEQAAHENPEILQALGDHTPARHPSQLYEGILEGLVIFLLLYGMRRAFPRLWHGVITGTFFILYAIFRIGVENVRQPDADEILGMTKGQFYSTFMIVIGIGFYLYAFRKREGLKG
ncbi:MAG: prolipoprotein diacylglyceryl transferase [Akkermansiaceae bacterium]